MTGPTDAEGRRQGARAPLEFFSPPGKSEWPLSIWIYCNYKNSNKI